MRSCDILPLLLAETYEICEVQKHAVKCLESREVFNIMLEQCYKDWNYTVNEKSVIVNIIHITIKVEFVSF